MRQLVLTLIVSLCAFSQEADLAVVQKISGTVGFYTGDGKLVSTVKVGEHPHEAVLSPDKRLLYVSDNGILWMTYKGEGGNTISIVDVDKFKVTGAIQTGKWPCRLAVTPDGKSLVYALQNTEAVGFADLASKKEVAQVPLGGKLLSLTLSSDGRYAYSSAQEQDKIFVISLADRKVARVIEPPKGSGPDPVIDLR